LSVSAPDGTVVQFAPTVTPTATPATGVLGTAKTGETAGISAFPSVLILLSAAALLVFYEKRKRYGKNEKGEAK